MLCRALILPGGEIQQGGGHDLEGLQLELGVLKLKRGSAARLVRGGVCGRLAQGEIQFAAQASSACLFPECIGLASRCGKGGVEFSKEQS